MTPASPGKWTAFLASNKLEQAENAFAVTLKYLRGKAYIKSVRSWVTAKLISTAKLGAVGHPDAPAAQAHTHTGVCKPDALNRLMV